jgi:general secretion pathway protein F
MQYQLRVIRDGEKPAQIELDAVSALDARKHAEQHGYKVLKTTQKNKGFSLKRERFPLLLFSQELRVLIEAGLSLPDALETLAEKEHQAETRAIIFKVLDAIREGKQLSDAMSELPSAFPELFTATVRAAEKTGDLPEALSRYALYLEQIDVLKRRIISASVYPALVLAFGALVVVFLMAYVVPRFSKIYATHHGDVSYTTAMLLKAGKFSQEYGLIVVALLVVLGLIAMNLLAKPDVRAKIVDWFWHLPYLGEKIKIYHLSRLYRTFSMLLKSGIPVVTGLGMVNQLLGTSLQINLSKAKNLISEGRPFSEAFDSSDLITPVSLRLFRVGERTGQLESMMERAATFHEEEMTRWVDALTKIFEPLLITAIGVVIGGIVLMMYLPIFELASGLD